MGVITSVRPTVRNGVGSRFRATINYMESSLPENDSRPGVFNLWLSRPIGLIPFLFLPRGERCPRLVRCEVHVPR
jgi:hypothetical protein